MTDGRTTIVLSLPHPFDGTLNLALEACDRSDEPEGRRVLGHAATSASAMYSHLRRVVTGAPIRRRIVRSALDWVQQHVLPHPEVVLYNRFCLADFASPFARDRLQAILETFWLYGFRRRTRFVFVDYGEALGGSRAFCRARHFEEMLSRGVGAEAAAERIAAFDAAYDATSADLAAGVDRVFGRHRFDRIAFRGADDLADLLRLVERPFGASGEEEWVADADAPQGDVLPRLRNHLSRVTGPYGSA